MSASQVDFRANCLRLADYLENKVPPEKYYHANADGSCGSPCCAFGHARLMGLVPKECPVRHADTYFGPDSYGYIFCGGAFRMEYDVNMNQVTPKMAAQRLREYANLYHPAAKELKSGAEICRALIAKPFQEKAEA